jgi:two-component system, OmpR family, response regulator
MSMRILVVEDEERLCQLIRKSLCEFGYAVDMAFSGEEALEWTAAADYDSIILDVMLPGIDGLEVCKTLRSRSVQMPILLLTARDAVEHRVEGLDSGADDYLTKPFAVAELMARLRALERRPPDTLDPVLRIGDLTLDPRTLRVWRGGQECTLTNKEFRILEYLMRHPNQVLTRTMIAEHVWDYDFPNVTNVIDVHIRALRRKLDRCQKTRRILTVRGVGYRLVGDDG